MNKDKKDLSKKIEESISKTIASIQPNKGLIKEIGKKAKKIADEVFGFMKKKEKAILKEKKKEEEKIEKLAKKVLKSAKVKKVKPETKKVKPVEKKIKNKSKKVKKVKAEIAPVETAIPVIIPTAPAPVRPVRKTSAKKTATITKPARKPRTAAAKANNEVAVAEKPVVTLKPRVVKNQAAKPAGSTVATKTTKAAAPVKATRTRAPRKTSTDQNTDK